MNEVFIQSAVKDAASFPDLVRDWESQRVREKFTAHPIEAIRAISRLKEAAGNNLRACCPAAVILLSAVVDPLGKHVQLPPAEESLFVSAVEGLVVPTADFAAHFFGFEYILSAFRDVLNYYVHVRNTPSGYLTCLRMLDVVRKSLAPNLHHLTPAHPLFLQVALQRNHLTAAKPLLALVITEIDPVATGVTLSDFMSFFYYSGLIFAAGKQWTKALEVFESAMAVPKFGSSAILVACYKAFVFVSLIRHGSVANVPGGNQHLDRLVRVLAREYLEFAEAFKHRNVRHVRKSLVEFQAVYAADQLLDLAKLAEKSLLRHIIRSSTTVYVTSSLNALASEAQCTAEDVREVLLDMIEDGEVRALIDTSSPPFTVTFLDQPPATEADIHEAIERCMAIQAHVSLSNRDVVTSEAFAIERLRNDPAFSAIMQAYELKRGSQSGNRSTLERLTSLLQ